MISVGLSGRKGGAGVGVRWKSWNFITSTCVYVCVCIGIVRTLRPGHGTLGSRARDAKSVSSGGMRCDRPMYAAAGDRRMTRETNAHCLPSRKLRRLYSLFLFSPFPIVLSVFSFETHTHVRMLFVLLVQQHYTTISSRHYPTSSSRNHHPLQRKTSKAFKGFSVSRCCRRLLFFRVSILVPILLRLHTGACVVIELSRLGSCCSVGEGRIYIKKKK